MSYRISTGIFLLLLLTACAVMAQNGIWRPDCEGLARAVMNQEVEPVRRVLLYNPTMANARDNTGWSLLHCAVATGNYEMTVILLDSKAFINTQSEEGITPLHHAIMKGNTKIAGLLITRGASLAIEDKKGNTPLKLAESLNRCEIVEIMRRQGAVK